MNSQDLRPQKGRLGEWGCHLRGLREGPRHLFPSQLPLFGQKDGDTMGTPVMAPTEARWGLLTVEPLSDSPGAQGNPLATSQTLSLSGAFFPDKDPVWATLGDLFEPLVGECEGEKGFFFKACTLIFCATSSQSRCSPPGLAALPASCC